jgi:hypothetical protein
MITSGVVNSAKGEFLSGVHTSTDTYKIALYVSEAKLGPDTENYSAQNEASDPGYEAGGKVLSGHAITVEKDIAIFTFSNPIWENASITARGAMIYNSSKENRTLAVFDFGEDVTSTNDSFSVILPTEGLIQLS